MLLYCLHQTTVISQYSARINSIFPQNIHTMTTRSERLTVVDAQLVDLHISMSCTTFLYINCFTIWAGLSYSYSLKDFSVFMPFFFLVRNVVQIKLLISSGSVNVTLLGYTIYNSHIYNYITLDFHAVSHSSSYHSQLPSDPVSSPFFTFSED